MLLHRLQFFCTKNTYRNFPKFSDRQVWANSVDPDQSLIKVYTVCNSVYVFWANSYVVKQFCSNFRIITAIFWVSEFLGFLR